MAKQMRRQISMALPPPDLWQDFERLTLEVAHCAFNDSGASAYGNQGAPQNGVDVYCRENSTGRLIGIQCKRRKGGALKASEIATEIANAKAFTPSLDHFILATTDTRRVKIQDEERIQNAKQIAAKSFTFQVWFWDEFLSFLHKYAPPLQWYYDNILKLQGVYNVDHQILYLFHMAMSRPAFTTKLDAEEGGQALLDALRDTETALTIGQLQDRETKALLRVAPGGIGMLSNDAWRADVENVLDLVREARSKYKQARDSGGLVELSNRVQVNDQKAGQEIDRVRRDAVLKINSVLKQANLPEVMSSL